MHRATALHTVIASPDVQAYHELVISSGVFGGGRDHFRGPPVLCVFRSLGFGHIRTSM